MVAPVCQALNRWREEGWDCSHRSRLTIEAAASCPWWNTLVESWSVNRALSAQVPTGLFDHGLTYPAITSW